MTSAISSTPLNPSTATAEFLLKGLEVAKNGYAYVAGHLNLKVITVMQGAQKFYHKGQIVWSRLSPILKAMLLLCAQPVGISLAVLGISLIPLSIARSIKTGKGTAFLLYMLGIAIFAGGFFLFATSGIIPAFVST